MRPNPTESEQLSSKISVRFTTEEKSRLVSEAQLAGISTGEFVRRRCFGKAAVASVDTSVLNELRRLGRLLTQIHNESDGAFNPHTVRAISALTDYVEALSGDR